jgi:hypothetical protein
MSHLNIGGIAVFAEIVESLFDTLNQGDKACMEY